MLEIAGRFAYDLILLAVSFHAIRFGGRDEKIGAAIAIVASGGSGGLAELSRIIFAHRAYGVWCADVLVLAAWGALAIRGPAFWPLWATGVQLAALGMGAAAAMLPAAALRTYMLIQGKWAYLVLLALLLGSIRHRRLRVLNARAAGLPTLSSG